MILHICQHMYNNFMDVTKYLKSLLTLNGLTIIKLAEILTQRTGKVYTAGSLSAKIRRQSITLKEAYEIAEILGYNIEFNRK